MKYVWLFGAVILILLSLILDNWKLGVIGNMWFVFSVVEKLKEDGI